MQIPKVTHHNMLADSMYNCNPDCTRNEEDNQTYGKGVLVGVVGAFMAMGLDFDSACNVARQHGTKFDMACVPESWRHNFS